MLNLFLKLIFFSSQPKRVHMGYVICYKAKLYIFGLNTSSFNEDIHLTSYVPLNNILHFNPLWANIGRGRNRMASEVRSLTQKTINSFNIFDSNMNRFEYYTVELLWTSMSRGLDQVT